jgi:hypothetical protein
MTRRQFDVVRRVGLEPTHPYGHQDLNLARLPIPPPAQRVAQSSRPSRVSVLHVEQNLLDIQLRRGRVGTLA